MRIFVGLRPAVAEEHVPQARRRERGQPLGGPRANVQRQNVRVEGQLGRLGRNRPDHGRVRMAEQGHRVPAVKIPVLAAGAVAQPAAGAGDDVQGKLSVGVD